MCCQHQVLFQILVFLSAYIQLSSAAEITTNYIQVVNASSELAKVEFQCSVKHKVTLKSEFRFKWFMGSEVVSSSDLTLDAQQTSEYVRASLSAVKLENRDFMQSVSCFNIGINV